MGEAPEDMGEFVLDGDADTVMLHKMAANYGRSCKVTVDGAKKASRYLSVESCSLAGRSLTVRGRLKMGVEVRGFKSTRTFGPHCSSAWSLAYQGLINAAEVIATWELP